MIALRYLRDTAVFAPCYLALDWASYVHTLGPFNITPWNPQPALAIVWMLLGGLRYAPAVLVTVFATEVVVRSAPGGYGITLLTAATLAGGYALVAWALRELLRPVPGLRSTRQLTLFSAVAAGGTALIGVVFVGTLVANDLLEGASAAEAWLWFWVGDAVGVLVTAPLLLAAADARSRDRLLGLMRRPEAALQMFLLCLTLWLIFAGIGGDASRHFYLLFLPMIWIAARSGMSGAVVAIAIVQVGVVIGIHGETAGFPLVELQAFVAALTLTALYLGVTVEERERAVDGLRHTLPLAAAGEMAGAVAHEVNQPLTALANYGRSAQLLAAQGAAGARQLPAVIEKMLSETQRAAEVVRRLRDFFRSGTTRLEPVAVSELLAAAERTARQLVGRGTVVVETAAAGELPPLFVDRLQIELVLRNLVANAIEAVDDAGGGRVRIAAERDGAYHVRMIVTDNGPGVPAAARGRLFEPFSSGKASGMGLGLAVSLAIAEAHGGSLEARFPGHGEFHLVLPCVQNP